MVRYAAVVGYCGPAFSGWQIQPDRATVQETIEASIGASRGRPRVPVLAAGRTDAGVHAVGQVISFVLDEALPPFRLLGAINAHLPDTVRLRKIAVVPDDFDPRRCAQWREYRYFLWNGRGYLPHMRGLFWLNKAPWDDDAVRRAVSFLAGTHDFRAFCKSGECPENSLRTVIRASFRRRGAIGIVTLRANAFLMNMVRIIVGDLDSIGRGKRSPEWLNDLLRGVSRDSSDATAPPEGLYLWRVGYNKMFEWIE